MTYRELMGEIAALGFEETPTDTRIALFAVRRAIAGLFREYPALAVRTVRVGDAGEGRVILDLGALIPDLRELHGEITDGDGNAVPASEVVGKTLLLPPGFRTDLVIRYVRNPRLPDGNTPDEVLDVPREAEALVALLAASYLWLDSDPDKAQYYMSLYRDGLARLQLHAAHSHAAPYQITGWDA